MAIEPQPALLEGPGRISALAMYSYPAQDWSAEDIRRRAARFMRFFAPGDEQLDGLRVLVALAPRVLQGHPAAPAAPALPDTKSFRFDLASDVLVQIAAGSELHRTYALRVASSVFARGAVCRELLGARILNNQEPFGFRDGVQVGQPHPAALLPNGSGWLLYQQFAHDLDKFFAENPEVEQRAAVIGRAPVSFPGEPAPSPQRRRDVSARAESLPNTHVKRLSEYTPVLLRRGFPFRRDGSEGLAFLAVAADPALFGNALAKMDPGANHEGRDRILDYVSATEGGLFFVPNADPSWLEQGSAQSKGVAPLAALKGTLGPLARSGHMTTYETTSGFLRYLMTLREYGLFDDANRPSRISDEARGAIDSLYEALATKRVRASTPSKVKTSSAVMSSADPIASEVQTLQQLEATALEHAKDVNADNDDYITFG